MRPEENQGKMASQKSSRGSSNGMAKTVNAVERPRERKGKGHSPNYSSSGAETKPPQQKHS